MFCLILLVLINYEFIQVYPLSSTDRTDPLSRFQPASLQSVGQLDDLENARGVLHKGGMGNGATSRIGLNSISGSNIATSRSNSILQRNDVIFMTPVDIDDDSVEEAIVRSMIMISMSRNGIALEDNLADKHTPAANEAIIADSGVDNDDIVPSNDDKYEKDDTEFNHSVCDRDSVKTTSVDNVDPKAECDASWNDASAEPSCLEGNSEDECYGAEQSQVSDNDVDGNDAHMKYGKSNQDPDFQVSRKATLIEELGIAPIGSQSE